MNREPSREPKEKNIYSDIDLSLPVDKSKLKVSDEDCFGILWDMGSKECPLCAMNEICCIPFQDKVNKQAEEIQAKNVVFLDQTDFSVVDPAKLLSTIKEKSGKMTVAELVTRVKVKADTADDMAAIEWIKRFVKSHDEVYTKEGIVWHR